MATLDEIKETYVIVDTVFGGSSKYIRWVIHNELQFGKLETMTVTDAVDYMLSDPTISEPDRRTKEISDELKEFITEKGRGFYNVGTADGKILTCKVNLNTMEVLEDLRQRKVVDLLKETTAKEAGKDKKIYYQKFMIGEPIFLGYDN